MVSFNFSRIALATSAIFALAAADCQMSNEGGSGIETDDTLCVPQGEGSYTFAMGTQAVEVPDPGGPPNAGYAGGTTFYIFDNACNTLGAYAPCSGGITYTIEENFLADVLSITSVDMGLGGGYFQFYYGNGEFTIGNNGCTCQDDSSGLEGGQGCKCAFPQNGVV